MMKSFLLGLLSISFILMFTTTGHTKSGKSHQRVFVDTVYKITEKGAMSAVTFRRAAAVYMVSASDKAKLERLSASQKSKKAVEVTADTNNNQILDVK